MLKFCLKYCANLSIGSTLLGRPSLNGGAVVSEPKGVIEHAPSDTPEADATPYRNAIFKKMRTIRGVGAVIDITYILYLLATLYMCVHFTSYFLPSGYQYSTLHVIGKTPEDPEVFASRFAQEMAPVVEHFRQPFPEQNDTKSQRPDISRETEDLIANFSKVEDQTIEEPMSEPKSLEAKMMGRIEFYVKKLREIYEREENYCLAGILCRIPVKEVMAEIEGPVEILRQEVDRRQKERRMNATFATGNHGNNVEGLLVNIPLRDILELYPLRQALNHVRQELDSEFRQWEARAIRDERSAVVVYIAMTLICATLYTCSRLCEQDQK